MSSYISRVPTRRHTTSLVASALAISAVLLASCGGSSPNAASAQSPTPHSLLTAGACPTNALVNVKHPVDVDFWESMSNANANGQTLTALTNQFNSSQNQVHVTLVEQGGYDVTWQKYQAGLTNGQLPNIAQLQDIDLQAAIDTKSFIPVQACINASSYSTSDYVQRILSYWKVSGVQWAMPFSVSNPVLYYNSVAFEKAGLNPNAPPATLSQMISDARKLKAAGYESDLKLDNWHLETWLATANQLFVNNANGRSARATKAVFDTPTGLRIYTELDQLVRSGLAVTNPSTGPDDYDNLLGIGDGKYAMTIDTSAALGTIQQLLASGKYPGVKLGVGPFPALSASTPGGVEPGGSALYISAKSTPVERAAAWKYITYLDNTQSQATWAAGTGYIPVRLSSTQTPTIVNLWKDSPGFAVAYRQLLSGANTPATSGAVIGDYVAVRAAELNAEESMYEEGVSPKNALANAQRNIDNLLASYNQRVG